MALKQMFGKPPLAPPKAPVQQQPTSKQGVLSVPPQSNQQKPYSHQPSSQTASVASAPGLRQQLNMPPVAMNVLTSGTSASSAIEQLKKHAGIRP
jgi:hypothetical protein